MHSRPDHGESQLEGNKNDCCQRPTDHTLTKSVRASRAPSRKIRSYWHDQRLPNWARQCKASVSSPCDDVTLTRLLRPITLE
jgi:hypothetical protein